MQIVLLRNVLKRPIKGFVLIMPKTDVSNTLIQSRIYCHFAYYKHEF